ncbi:hypothetical protein KCU95_g3788, partial [Aureobasidium melanogenum]
MSGLAPPPARRQTLTEFFEGFFENDDGTTDIIQLSDERLAQIEEIERTVGESEGFRIGATSTNNRRDRHLSEYRSTCILQFIKEGRQSELIIRNNSGPENDPLFFPEDRESFWKLVKIYLTWMTKQVQPRNSTDTRPRLATIANRRWSILYWARVYMKSPPSFITLQARTNSALFFAVDKFGVNMNRRDKPYFGRHELRYLIDHDLEKTDAFDVAESHHAVWTLALVCGVRPGAIGWSTHRRSNYLRWKDVTIRRDTESPSKFDMTIEFPYMKGYQDASAKEFAYMKVMVGRGREEGYLRLTLRAPSNPDNILLSPTVRLLAIALKRGILAQYKTIEELLTGNHVEVMISPEHLNDPVFLAATPGGRSLDMNRPASAAALTAYLGKRAKDAGFESGTMYAFRRKAANNVDRAAGRDALRQFMHHTPTSTAYENHYEDANFDLDITAIAMDEVMMPQQTSAQRAPILFRASLRADHATVQTRIDAYVNEHIDKSLDGHRATNERRRLKRLAWKALDAENQALQRETFTLEQLKARQAELRGPSKLMSLIRSRIEKPQADSENLGDNESDEFEDDENEDEEARLDLEEMADVDFSTHDESEPDVEPDLSTTAPLSSSKEASQNIELGTDREFDCGRVFDVSYDDVLYNFLEVMLEGDSQTLAKGSSRPCQECLSDDTVPVEKKFHKYKNQSDLQRHLESNIHSPLKKWLRRMAAAQAQDEEGFARCYCGRAYAHLNKLQDHLEKVRDKGVEQDNPHFAGMTEDGWLLPNWEKSRRSANNSRRIQAERQREREDLGRVRPQVEVLTKRVPSTIVPGAYSGPEEPSTAKRLQEFMRRTAHLPELTPEYMRAKDEANGTVGLSVEWITEEELLHGPPSEREKRAMAYLQGMADEPPAAKKARK